MGVIAGEESRGADAHKPAVTGGTLTARHTQPRHKSRMLSISVCFQNEVTALRTEVSQLKQILLTHKDCPVTTRQREAQVYPSE